MKKVIFSLSLMLALISFTSCSDSENVEEPLDNVSSLVENLYAPVTADYSTGVPITSGEFTRFSFATGTEVTDDSWDIAFRGTTILVNGGKSYGYVDEPERTGDAALALETGVFTEITEASSQESFSQDAVGALALTTGSDNGWYTYNATTHLISPIAGRVLVVKTIDGNYAKVEILSYYKDYDTSSDSRYYSFNYLYNPNTGDTSL